MAGIDGNYGERIDLGCGPQNKHHCIKVDQPGSKQYYPHVDYELDLSLKSWPQTLSGLMFDPDKPINPHKPFQKFDTIYAEDIVEHLPNLVNFMNECWQIAEPGAKMFIRTPSYDAPFGWIDPTHVRLYALDTWDFFDPSTDYGKYNIQLTPFKWKVLSKKRTDNGNLEIELERF